MSLASLLSPWLSMWLAAGVSLAEGPPEGAVEDAGWGGSEGAPAVAPAVETAGQAPPSGVETAVVEAAPTQSEAAPAVETASREPAYDIRGSPGNGVTVAFGRIFSLNLRGRIQVRAQFDVSAPGEGGVRVTEQVVNIGTARLWVSGHVLDPRITYMLQLAVAERDFREPTPSPIFDAFVDWKAHRDIQLRAGQFFVPLDRLRTVREWALQMVDRPVPVIEMTLDRDIGLMAYSDTFLSDRSPFAWRVGIFGGGGTHVAREKPPGALIVARVELRPFGPLNDDIEGDLERRRGPALALGIAGAGNVRTNRPRSTTGPAFVGGTTNYAHAAADLVFKFRGLAIQGEYLLRKADRDVIRSIDDEGMALLEYTRSGQAWVVQASYVFRHPVEVVGRLSAFYPFETTDPTWVGDASARGQETGAGLNYYVHAHKFKVQLGWIARTPRDFDFARAEHKVVAQLDMTF